MNPSPDYEALLRTLDQPLVPELSSATIEALAYTFARARAHHPDTTAVMFLEQILLEGLIHRATALRDIQKRRCA